MSAATKLLDRLDNVRQTGTGRWLARCPAHEDKSPSLSIRELDDGRVLLHDFAGCSTENVLGVLGLTLADLFDKPLDHSLGPAHSRIPARDLLDLISAETSVVTIVAADMLSRKTITDTDWSRLSAAASRIFRARDHAHGR